MSDFKEYIEKSRREIKILKALPFIWIFFIAAQCIKMISNRGNVLVAGIDYLVLLMYLAIMILFVLYQRASQRLHIIQETVYIHHLKTKEILLKTRLRK